MRVPTHLIVWCIVLLAYVIKTSDMKMYNAKKGYYAKKMYYPKKRSMNLLAFHTALKANVPFYEQRRLPLITAVSKSDADVLCLTEIWYNRDMLEVQKALRHKYPYSFSAIHNNDDILIDDKTLATPPCEPEAFQRVFTCVVTTCNQPNPFVQYICFATTCKGFEMLSAECTACVLTSGPNPSLCSNPQGPVKSFIGPGMAIFSKFPLRQRKTQDLLPGYRRLLPRWLFTAKVKGLGKIGCVHFSSPYPGPYIDPESPPLFSSYKEHNLNNTLETLKYIRKEKRFILLGDSNNSPGRADLTPFNADNYQKIIDRGFSNPYVDNNGPATLGYNNPLSFYKDGLFIFDQIFSKGFTAISHKRVFDTFIDVGNISIPLSNHYGVSVTFKRKRRMYKR